MRYKLYLMIAVLVASFSGKSQDLKFLNSSDIQTGAERIDEWIGDLDGMSVGVVANQSSLIGREHLVDVLRETEVNLIRVFAPEHGFRGKASAGELIKDEVDSKTGLPIVSLYGKNKKPGSEVLADLDVVIFDLQDVGARFYTYLSNLHYLMEACAENGVALWVLDRPNPNGYYVDGPVLKPEFTSFVGIHPIPVVHGCTLGELALMIKGEEWAKGVEDLNLKVVPCLGYDHNSVYELPVKPSPNLPNAKSVYLYPSLCFFEGTKISVGRGTDFPFQMYGAPCLDYASFSFVPEDREGAMNPKLEGETCYGVFLGEYAENQSKNPRELNLNWLVEAYNACSNKDDFFNPFFDKLAGTDALRKDIIQGLNPIQIRAKWKKETDDYQLIRSKYLLY